MQSVPHSQLLIAILSIWAVVCSGTLEAATPRELSEAEGKYNHAAGTILRTAKDDVEARQQLGELNRSFLRRLREIHPKVLARDREGARQIAERIAIVGEKLDIALDLTVLDARLTTRAKPKTNPLDDVPTGELESREEGGKIEVGERYEIKGRTSDIPDGHVVRVFAGTKFRGIFPRENNKDPNRRFVVTETASEVWIGPVVHLLLSVPESLMEEIEVWHAARRRWEDAGFPKDAIPPFRGAPTQNIYLDSLVLLGVLKLADHEVEYVR